MAHTPMIFSQALPSTCNPSAPTPPQPSPRPAFASLSSVHTSGLILAILSCFHLPQCWIGWPFPPEANLGKGQQGRSQTPVCHWKCHAMTRVPKECPLGGQKAHFDKRLGRGVGTLGLVLTPPSPLLVSGACESGPGWHGSGPCQRRWRSLAGLLTPWYSLQPLLEGGLSKC